MASDPHLTVTRRIHFFRVSHFGEIALLLPASLEAISNLPWEGQGRYQPDATDNSLLSVMPHSFQYPLRIEFGRTRRDNLPEIERKGIKKTLSIAEDAGLIDISHLVIFSDGFVAAEFNRDAPRIRKLGDYLMFKGRNLPSVPRFQRLFERDIIDKIEDLSNVKFLEIEIPPDNIEIVKKADKSLAHAFEAQQQVSKSKTLGLYFNSRDSSDGRLKNLSLALVQAMRGVDGDDVFEKLQIRGTDPSTRRPRTLNLLEDYLVADVNFERSSKKARSVQTDAAFRAIEEVYLQRREALENAVRGILPWD